MHDDDADRRRQGSLLLYGLTEHERTREAARMAAVAGDVEPLLNLARAATGADIALLNLFDADLQATILATPGFDVEDMPREESICWPAANAQIDAGTPSAVYSAPDASTDPVLRASPYVSGEKASIRLYAGAPLVGQEGETIGMMCVLGARPKQLSPEQLALLSALRDAAMLALNERRRQLESSATWLPPAVAPAAPVVARKPRRADINQVIDARDVQVDFQPVVRLSSGAVVGFEAFTRGPEGTDLEAPASLMAAAAEAGRTAELDWVCRTAALQAALDADLHPSLSWFINVKPTGLDVPCPKDLEGVESRARLRLRVMLELTEKDSNGYVSRLLQAVGHAREASWGVSLDDVGSQALSLSLLPLLQPDVVKINLRHLAGLPEEALHNMRSAVNAHAEANGSEVLILGIEDELQHNDALAHGAQYGQGWFYGRPGPLPASVPVPREAIPLRQRFTDDGGQTPFDILREARPVRRAGRRHLIGVSEHFERQGRKAVDTCVLLACFQHVDRFPAKRAAQYEAIASLNAFTMAVGEGFPEHVAPRYRLAALNAENRLAGEWTVIIVGPHSCGALAARPTSGVSPRGERLWEYVETQDRQLVVRAARSFLHHSENPALRREVAQRAEPVPEAVLVGVGAEAPLDQPRSLLRRLWS